MLPNTTFRALRLRVVAKPTATWLLRKRGRAPDKVERLFVTAGSAKGVRSVRFLDGRAKIAKVTRSIEGLYADHVADGQGRPREARAARGRDRPARQDARP